jgi:hypothetical protein
VKYPIRSRQNVSRLLMYLLRSWCWWERGEAVSTHIVKRKFYSKLFHPNSNLAITQIEEEFKSNFKEEFTCSLISVD